MKTKNFIVPHDFSNVADTALEHAIATAKHVNAEINVLHVVAKGKDLKEAEQQLTNVLAKFDSSVKLIPNVRIGSIFEDIGDFAAEKHAELIFMGTHGIQGWQHITGSNALKVINSSSVPFIIVQEKSPKDSGYDDIIVPLDLNKETKQKLAVVAEIATYFKSRVHVITPDESDEFLKKQVKANILFASKFFSERGIDVTTTVAPSHNFDNEIVKHAVAVGGDLIAFMNLNKNNLLGVLTANHEVALLNNEAQIPTLIMNPIEGISSLAVDFNG
ncbi:universal stress protein [Crocinitomicaceae bacterium CZZ-1]|uniref:Universal stress protein n=1 Tax=Taishania pollutisoli TaxID=2766479 RepID=A0A8J6PAB2_9FLAO|nr:universal stress protein [Taishania pollutisoli]MBC9810992.1 universal stress protein [Taishania pollutisoli]MBX2950149.1 universal stress protein [Crocinitomicaceae bacterium]NGF76629.1 universal stress protein [Fluviicola sp. SGL-29]